MSATEDLAEKFGAIEYGIFGLVLVVSAAIGIYHGCKSKQKSTEEFLMANRQMSSVPVALSLLCSFVSAITLLGNPTEIYLYGVQYGLIALSFIPLTLTLIYLYVPVFFNLGISSAYEYLELRFGKGTRMFVSLLAIFHLVVYMAIVVYGPSLAISQVTGINTRLSTGAIFIVCIFYSSLGGLKAVLWTDALQAVIMLGALVVVVIKGILDVGGMAVVWDRIQDSDRDNFFNFDPDPRTRHTVWTATIGGFFMWLPMYAATQQQIQRYLSLPSLVSCKRALLMNMVGLIVITILCFLAGLVIYGKYFDCDPIKNDVVTSPDQLLPLFVMETSGGIPGLPGLFVAGITCASLSTVSSGLSALASILTYDYLKKFQPNLSDERLSFFSKIFSVLFGAISFAFVFVAENMGSILPATSSLVGMIVGPTLGIFTLGMFFPFSNSKGSVLGMLTAFVVMIALAIGTFIANSDKLLPDQSLFLTTAGCPSSSNSSTSLTSTTIEIARSTTEQTVKDWKQNGDSLLIQFLSISYIWYPGLGCLITVVCGLFFSFLVNLALGERERPTVRPDLISPPMLTLWNKLWPSQLAKWINQDDNVLLINIHKLPANLRPGGGSRDSTLKNFKKEPFCDVEIKPI